MKHLLSATAIGLLLASTSLAEGVSETDLAGDQASAGDVLTNGMGPFAALFAAGHAQQVQREKPDPGLGLQPWRRKAARSGNPAAGA